ncbi:MAG: hypothetical protein BGN88_01325 [Clostridiales bacterium 43-6]|nr:MAG: hypothetical protein BGN88_01325 [Clostridiales bacterium 43-6]
MPKRYTEKEKQEIVRLYQTSYSAKEICVKFGISRSSLFLWAQQYSEINSEVKTAREVYLIEKEIARLRIENQIFKESGCSVTSSTDEKYTAVLRLRDKYSIHALCDTLELSRGTYYNRALRSPAKTQNELEDEEIKPLIKYVFEESEKRFGARKIKVKLKERGHQISERRIHRLMKEMNLSLKSTYVYPNATFSREYKYYPNRLKQKFHQIAPNLVWISDFTYVKVGSEVYQVCAIIDLFSRKVLAAASMINPDADFLISLFNTTFIERGCPDNLMLHSDQGTQYASYKFRCFVRELKVKQSFSRTATPYDNAVAESFFSSLKKEEFKKRWFETKEMLDESTQKYVQFFNENRPHQTLGYKTPNQLESEFYSGFEIKECSQ